MMIFILLTLAICLIFSIFALVNSVQCYDKSSDDNKVVGILFVMNLMIFLSVVFQLLILSK